MEDIIKSLQSIEQQGYFYGLQRSNLDDFSLEIKGIGEVKWPLSVSMANKLIKTATPAKFGWRDMTLLDKTVRNAWEVPKSKVKIDKRRWNKTFNPVLDGLKKDLGLPAESKLKAMFHSLLVYEPGQFFNAHQDSEKLDGMVATLVIVLPSKHRGGSLIIDHQGEKKRFQTSRFPLDKLSFMAFYADCHHEVKEITEGYRVTLTYNLVLENSIDTISAPNQKKSTDEVMKALKAYFYDVPFQEENISRIRSSTPKQCVYLLDHSYTPKGLSWSHLKNGDRLRAQALISAAKTLDLEISLTLADVQETWDCVMDYEPRRYRHGYYDKYLTVDEDDIELTELLCSDTVLKHWVSDKNEPLNYGDYSVSSSYIGWTKSSDEFKPFESEYEGFMGNYGNTMDRWYHRAAIVLWLKKEHYSILFNMDEKAVIKELQGLAKRKTNRDKVHQILVSLQPYWNNTFSRYADKSIILAVIKLASYVSDNMLAKSMLENFNIDVLTSQSSKQLAALQKSYGTDWCLEILNQWTKPQGGWSTISVCENFSKIVSNLTTSKIPYEELTNWLIEFQLNKLIEQDNWSIKHSSLACILEKMNDRISYALDFLDACLQVDQKEKAILFLDHLMTNPLLYSPITLVSVVTYLVDSLSSNDLEDWHVLTLAKYVNKCLQEEKRLGIREKDDWSIMERSKCGCDDCAELMNFLQLKTARRLKWPMGKERRRHIHRVVEGLGIPVTHHTEHAGSPHKLILEKTEKLHDEAKTRFSQLEEGLNSLLKLSVAL